MGVSADVLRTWTVADSAELYGIRNWGKGLFSVSPTGTLVVHPSAIPADDPAASKDNPGGPGIDVKELVDDLIKRGISSPLLLRFPDILARRITALNEAFTRAIKDNDYRGQYRGVYPIKVNQDRLVVETIVNAGASFHYGLEAGSKPELLAVIALLTDPDALVICNGYKDASYVETALLACKLGLHVIMVVEKPTELKLIHEVSRRLGITPHIGIRIKLSARGAGRWEQSGGDRSKFGLSSRELMEAVSYMREHGLLPCFELLHFHLGSQISAIKSVKNALREAARFYVELMSSGAALKYVDVGGGLGVDYDGSQTNFSSSMNYTMQEYANDIVYGLREICNEAGVPHPTIVTESGRAVTAHHAVLIVDVLGVNALAPRMPERLPEDAEPTVRRLWEAQQGLTRKNYMETYHDALDLKEEALQLFNLGHLSLSQRVWAESVFWALCERILRIVRDSSHVPDDLEGLEKAMSDTYFCNFSVFQSLPDSWAVEQLFPVAPIHRLNEKPIRRGVLADITCDSDGEISRFIDLKDVKDVLELHELRPGEDYHLGIFLVGAYQEILGDMHNLFGDTNEVHVSCSPGGGYKIEHVVAGDTVEDVLKYVGFDRKDLVARLRRASEEALRTKRITFEESKHLMRLYDQGLSGYTYLEEAT
ncbi:MAG: biosynthetic arginine decarboxylase [Planctomycetes bacterium]|nr:biosynthetic arginine decarboxylase [Planctomycetota bacterium]